MDLIIFSGTEVVGEGNVREAIDGARRHLSQHPGAGLLVLDRQTSNVRELDIDQPFEVIERTLALQAGDRPEPSRRGRGRPKLGVVSREVSLLPRHWEWLGRQPGGASAALRKLVEAARRSPDVQAEEARASVDRFLRTLAGDLPDYEEVLRQFYRRQYGVMFEHMAAWPDDIQRHARALVNEVQHWEIESGTGRRRTDTPVF